MRRAGRCGARREGAAHARDAAKLIQGKPNKSKEKSLDFLGFLWPNWAFSMGYGESKKKISSPLLTSRRKSLSGVRSDSALGKASMDSVFRK
jgi:hypothetical protein